jgi:myo-inositol-hexaphosphate 3-phosphohydrolase
MNRTTFSVAFTFGVCLAIGFIAPLPMVSAAIPVIELVPASGETVPVQTSGDSADDPAIWVHPTTPEASLIIGNNKRGALETYDLSGNRVQQLRDSVTFWGNVDNRYAVQIGANTRDLIAVSHRGLQFYTVNPDTRQLRSITDGVALATSGEGVCLYRSPTTSITYAVVITIKGRVRQYELTDVDLDGLIDGRLVRDFQLSSEAEGCVADDEAQALYISQEDVALWKFEAEPTLGNAGIVVDSVTASGGQLEPDIEGVTIADTDDGGKFLFASAQRVSSASQSYFTTYQINDRFEGLESWTQHKSFRVGNGLTADDCDRTDGIAAYAGDLGPQFPYGIFVCQDNNNSGPRGTSYQDFKYVRLEAILPHLVGS